ncbi:MAG TPA: InlB B-repeat-containing protein [Thermomicrobiales bacterium]|nr:InlB B-repeat-containing protein [Thermomicrobiales bacterium]
MPGQPRIGETQPATAGAQAATDLVTFQNTALGSVVPSGDDAASANEPSVSSDGNTIFYTGNWYAAVSTDAGSSFTYLNPYTDFPAAYGGFCCDQVTIYDPSRNITVWELQYETDASGNNIQRLAVAHGQGGVAGNTWTYWDITAQLAGYPAGYSLDYPHLALSANDLYLSTNVFANGSASSVASVLYRFPLSDLAAGGTLHYDNFISTLDTLTPVEGATTTMYFGAHVSTSTLRVYSWPENSSSSSVTYTDVSHSAYVAESRGSGQCVSPDGTNMCGFGDSRILTGWVAGGVLGFMWDAAQGTGGLGTFPYPYVHVVRINQASMTLIDEPVIWSSAAAWAYPGVGIDGRGAVGGSVAYGGGTYYPGSSVFVRDDLDPTTWQFLDIREGTSGPTSNRWGDFLTARPASGTGDTWVASTFTLQSGSVEPRFVWFGRQRDTPFYTLALSATAGGSAAAAPAPGPYAPGTVVTLTATANAGYAFTGWTVDGASAGSANPLALTMNANHTVVANFAPVYTLALSATAGGTISASPPGPTYVAGTPVTLTATAYSGYTFVGWTLDGAPAGNADPGVLTMNANHTVVANFAPAAPTWSAWASQGGILTDSPAAAGLGSRVYVFAKGSDAALYVKSSDTAGNFTDWQDLGGILTAAPASASFNGRLYAFAKGSDNALYVKSSADGVNWTDWSDQGGILLAPPAAASAAGKLFVFAMGTDRALYAKATADGVTWTDWQRLGGILTAAPAAAGFQGRIYAFAKGSDNALYVKSSADGLNWTDWSDLGGTLAAAPAAATTGDGATLYAFGTGPGGTVSERHTTDGAGWTGWADLGGQVVGPPAAASTQGGPLFVFARWVDNALWERHLNP